jgi:hypothetical protein
LASNSLLFSMLSTVASIVSFSELVSLIFCSPLYIRYRGRSMLFVLHAVLGHDFKIRLGEFKRNVHKVLFNRLLDKQRFESGACEASLAASSGNVGFNLPLQFLVAFIGELWDLWDFYHFDFSFLFLVCMVSQYQHDLKYH